LDSKVQHTIQAAGSGGFAEAAIRAELKTGKLRLHHVEESLNNKSWVRVAWARYNNTVGLNGWAHLSVTATHHPLVSNELKMYAAGFLEGIFSAKQIRDFQHNTLILLKEQEKWHHALGNMKNMFAVQLSNILKKSGSESSCRAP